MPTRIHRVRFTSNALVDLELIGAYIRSSSSEAADRVLSELELAAQSLRTLPARGRSAPEGLVHGIESRQIVRLGFRIIYTIENDEVRVHAFVHHARLARELD